MKWSIVLAVALMTLCVIAMIAFAIRRPRHIMVPAPIRPARAPRKD